MRSNSCDGYGVSMRFIDVDERGGSVALPSFDVSSALGRCRSGCSSDSKGEYRAVVVLRRT